MVGNNFHNVIDFFQPSIKPDEHLPINILDEIIKNQRINMSDPNPISAVLLILITILCEIPNTEVEFAAVLTILRHIVPPAGVFLIAGCGADLLINICLTVLG